MAPAPTFAQYLTWASEKGCVIESGVVTEESINVTKITAPSGRIAVEIGTQHYERLTPTTVGRLDRRLGLLSPWFASPLDS
jgi:hypothetical protein